MKDLIQHVLTETPPSASAPCRIDMGGTLDISTFSYPLSYLEPATFNIALNMRTRVEIGSHSPGMVLISSAGFESAEYPLDNLPFSHPMGLMFAIAAHFRIDGIHIEITSASPPRSALGGSSAAAVALVGAYSELLKKAGGAGLKIKQIPLLAHAIEQSVAGVPCGLQDQLAAAYGGVNAWYWKGVVSGEPIERKILLEDPDYPWLEERMLVAYCGNPHESSDVNGTWVRRFIEGADRDCWVNITSLTNRFIRAFSEKDLESAISAMNRETAIRREITPHVVDEMGEKLVSAAIESGCGARFSGAGGGGCIWGLGEPGKIRDLKCRWSDLVSGHEGAVVLEVSVDAKGLESG